MYIQFAFTLELDYSYKWLITPEFDVHWLMNKNTLFYPW